MSVQDIKLAQVRKSCKAAKIVSRIMMIIGIAGTILCLIGIGALLIFGSKLDQAVQAGQGFFSVTNPEIHGLLILKIDLEKLVLAGEYAAACRIACTFGAIITFGTAIIFAIITRIFVMIEQNETPFVDAVMKAIKTAFIVITIVLTILEGVGPGVMIGVCLWSIYTILDYGCCLQTEVDDTI